MGDVKVTQSEKQLWETYLFLTREMHKFIEREEYELFEELMRQREVLQERIDDCIGSFKATEQGQNIIETVRELNVAITQKVQLYLNRFKHQEKVSQAYDGYGGYGNGAVGRRFDTIR